MTITPSGTSYDLKAVDASGAAVETFAVSPVLTIAYDPSQPAPSTIYYVDPVNGLTPVPSTVDPAAHTISAALQHFSDYTTGDQVTTTLSLNPIAGAIGPRSSSPRTSSTTRRAIFWPSTRR